MGLITPKTVAEKLAANLRHELSLDGLAAWAESALMKGEFDPVYILTIRDIVNWIGGGAVCTFASPGKSASNSH